jgi:hypothetical protein
VRLVWDTENGQIAHRLEGHPSDPVQAIVHYYQPGMAWLGARRSFLFL